MSNIWSAVCTVTRDCEVRYLPNGTAVLNVNVANNQGFGDKQKTLFVRVALFGKRSEGQLQNYLKKGQQVFVSGELTQSEYRGNDGTTKTSLELNANIIDLVGKRNESSPSEQQNSNVKQSPSHDVNASYDAGVPWDNDIPF
ncbi:MAG: hypothetical protein RI893_1130 [Pseudomonadota bacterium]|jgi:single-strand DNA-binding protein